MIYVISDIHGCYDEFQQMLKKINFNPEKDELIIDGDIVDRGHQNLEMLRYMESKPKGVTFILGNHDADFLHYCRGVIHIYNEGLWREDFCDIYKSSSFPKFVHDEYGTVRELLANNKLTLPDFINWKKCFLEMPHYVERTVNDKNYIIVHGGYITEEKYSKNWRTLWNEYNHEKIEDFYVWARDEQLIFGGKENSTIIFGHTPTLFQDEVFYNNGYVWKSNRKDDNCSFINIDCGLVYKKNFPDQVEYGTLACIRLDDEKIFYLDEGE